MARKRAETAKQAEPKSQPTADPKELVGKQLGDYKLTSLLAAGGMARIYKAVDVKLGRPAAIKVLTQEMLETDETLTDRFQREAQAVAALEHDNIITLYQYGEQDGFYFLAMKLVQGEDLADELNRHMREGKLMDVKRALQVLTQVASALDAAHAAGIIHRDVKPSNILIDKASGKALLTDFGLVLRQQVDKTMGTAFGTPRYISPEQALASERAVPQSDIYSLAVIVYEILTGSMVFKADTAMQIALSHISEPPPPPRSINPNIPRAVERELLKALDKDPKKRHKTATQFVQAIREGYADAVEQIVPIPEEIIRSATPVMTSPPDWDKIRAEKQAADAAKTGLDFTTAKDKPTKRRRRRRRGLLRMMVSVALLSAASTLVFILTGGTDGNKNNNAGSGDNGPVVGLNIDLTDEATELAADLTPIVTLPVNADEPIIAASYNINAFALRNDGETSLDVSELSIHVGNVTRFSGSSVTGRTLEPGECIIILSAIQRDIDVRDDWNCGEITSPTVMESENLFWRESNATQFDVFLGDARVQSCDAINRAQEGDCDFNWPDAPASDS